MPNTPCVSEQDLRALVLGELPERIEQYVTEHLERCAACETAAQRLDTLCDPALAVLRHALRPNSMLQFAAGDTIDAPASCAVPERVGSYTVLEELGHGGMAVVYKARQDHPDRIVALKLLHGGRHSGAERRARFNAEGDAIARLHHPHIVQVHEAGEHDGLPYLVLEYCAGGNLAQRLGGVPQTPATALPWLAALASAVAHAHAAGVIHRDLKPANVLLTGDGQVKISDFGLARGERPELTATGAVLGTPSYMAPEQAVGGKDVGPRADVDALGAILYEILTGRPPFQGASALETLAQVRSEEPVPPRRLQPSLPRDLETICLKCLQKTPARRYASAAALADDLRLFQEGRPIHARPTGVIERSWRWCGRNPGWAAMLASVAILLTVIAVGASVGMVWLGQALSDSEADRLDATRNLERAQRAERATEEKLFEAQLAQARGISLSRRLGQRFDSLAVLADAARRARKLELPPDSFLALRNAAIAALALPDLHVGQRWDGFPDGSDSVAFNQDLTVYARTDKKGHCDVRRLPDEHLLQRLPAPAGGRLHLSPDGRFLALRYKLQLHVWKLDHGERTCLLTEQDVNFADFRASKPQMAVGHTDGAIAIWDLDPLRLLAQLPPLTLSRDIVLALHPNKPLVAVASYFANQAQVRNWKTGALVQRIDMPRSAYDVVWQAHGDFLAISDGDGPEIHLLDGTTFREFQTLRASSSGTRVTLSPAGDLLATLDWPGATHVFDVATGQLLVQTPPTKVDTPMWRPRFSGDGHRLAAEVAARRIGIWEVAAARECRTLVRSPRGREQHFAWPHVSHDNRLLAATADDGVHIWDLATGHWIGCLKGDFTGYSTLFLPGDPPALIASARSGVLRWPIQPVKADPGTLRIGPPKTVSPMVAYIMDGNRDGSVLVASARTVNTHQPFAGAWVFRSERSDAPLRLDIGKDMGDIAVSPDGARVATCPHITGIIKVYDARSGRLEKALGDDSSAFPRFSGDGRWLAISGEDGGLYDAKTWQPGLRFSGRAQFSPDSRLLAVATRTGTIRLLDIDRSLELAQLEDPDQQADHFHMFTPDGTRLVRSTTGAKGGIQVWDLRAIRRGLKELGLDWDAPDFPPEPRLPARPLKIEVVP